MSILEVDTAKRKFLSNNKGFPAKKEQTMFEAFKELSEAEIDAICKEARRELYTENPSIYEPKSRQNVNHHALRFGTSRTASGCR